MKNLCFLILGLGLFMAGYAQNWISLNSGTTNHLSSICFPDTNTGYTVGKNGTILKTTDGGINWFSQYYNDSYSFGDVQFINPDTGYITGFLPSMRSGGILLKTTDGGINWIKQEIDTTDYFNAIQLLGADTIFVNGSQVLRTFDGGTSWSVLNTPEGGPFWACNSYINFLVGAYVEIYNTIDGGENWETQFLGNAPGSVYEISFSNFSNGITVGGGYSQGIYYSLLYFTRTGGNPWAKSTYESDKNYNALFFTDDTTAYVVGNEGSILKTTDVGEYFTEEFSGTSETLSDVYFTSSGTGYIAGSNGTILKSSEPVGLPETLSSVEDPVTVYPNPFKDRLSIVCDGSSNIENTAVALYDPMGHLHFEKAVSSHVSVLNLQALIPGVYFLKITNPDHQYVIKLIKD